MLAIFSPLYYNIRVTRRHDGMVDVTDSKSVGGDIVWVRVPLPAPETLLGLRDKGVFLFSIAMCGDDRKGRPYAWIL